MVAAIWCPSRQLLATGALVSHESRGRPSHRRNSSGQALQSRRRRYGFVRVRNFTANIDILPGSAWCPIMEGILVESCKTAISKDSKSIQESSIRIANGVEFGCPTPNFTSELVFVYLQPQQGFTCRPFRQIRPLLCGSSNDGTCRTFVLNSGEDYPGRFFTPLSQKALIF